MQRTHRAVFLIFAILLLTASVMFRPSLRAAAEDPVILTVSGYRISVPAPGEAPFFTSTNLFAPLSMFTDMGVTVIEQAGLLILSNVHSGRILYFDLNAKTASDGSGVYELEPIRRNGRWFVPFIFTASRMNFDYAYVNASPAPFLRINYPDDTLMTDDAFLRYYESVAPHMLETTQTATTPVTHPQPTAPTETTSAVTTQTRPPETTTQSSTAEAITDVPEPPPQEYTVYAVIDGLAGADDAVAALRRAGLQAVFRVDPASVADNAETLRAVTVAGYGIVWAADDDTTPEQLDAANRLLFDCCRTVAKAAVSRNALSPAAERLLADQGYRVWAADLSVRGEPQTKYPAPEGDRAVILISGRAAQLLTEPADLLDGVPTFVRLSILCKN